MKPLVIFATFMMCLVGHHLKLLDAQSLADRIDQSFCRTSCLIFTKAHREGCCQLYNSCCTRGGGNNNNNNNNYNNNYSSNYN
ncbi:hypothetical protein X975_16959, partial [Stegodyphus mimosarum]